MFSYMDEKCVLLLFSILQKKDGKIMIVLLEIYVKASNRMSKAEKLRTDIKNSINKWLYTIKEKIGSQSVEDKLSKGQGEKKN